MNVGVGGGVVVVVGVGVFGGVVDVVDDDGVAGYAHTQ